MHPELVSRESDGQVQSVHYLTLISMLLDELQKQACSRSHFQARRSSIDIVLESVYATSAPLRS